jgi:hypothetical protein
VSAIRNTDHTKRPVSPSAPIPHKKTHGYQQRNRYDHNVCEHQSSYVASRPMSSSKCS